LKHPKVVKQASLFTAGIGFQHEQLYFAQVGDEDIALRYGMM